MSFSFRVQAATKAAVLNLVSAEMDKVVIGQPAHDADRTAAIKNAETALALVTEKDEGNSDYAVGVWGSITMSDMFGVKSVSISCTAEIAAKPAAA